MSSFDTSLRSLTVLLALGMLYLLLHVPIVMEPLPTTYHLAVQLNTVEVAISTAQTGLVYAPVLDQSYAGANLHGMLGAPVVTLGFAP